ncbi:structural maintenance of chromosomes flexible hinge domain-containing protein 1-like isoform X2 [Apostichopus japonicus]|uniref:structural maintenance of chromosomes flexible hinge domain-containing protein 1-like isoform X2 n=1 Tax=Stichopus japonicus TaxID=307972 RepID=UPI003AB49219
MPSSHSSFERSKAFCISKSAKFVVVTTDRKQIHDDDSYSQFIHNLVTLYILVDINQPLLAPTKERIDYLPHYDTLVKSGMYEYYASEGKNPLPFAFAELIDNALTATNENAGPRYIEVRMYFNDTPEKCMVCVLDNGRGMTSSELNNWAIYRLSKFSQRRQTDHEHDEPTRSQKRQAEEYPRFLNSDISYFGVGGKAAIFFIGQSARMISKSSTSADVHELSLSKEEFERREREKESIYKGYIHNRQAGDASHFTESDENIIKLLQEELGQESFTHVVITGIKPEHVQYLREDFNRWCTQLVHIYHYYLHGPEGNNLPRSNQTPSRANSPFRHINIVISHYNKGKLLQKRNLRDVDDDMQSKFLSTAAATFDFRARVEGDAVVEGSLRYHPFLYNKETYPLDNSNWYAPRDDGSDDDGFQQEDRPARGNRPIFDCYWNGRLIPYTTVDEFDWCGVPKRMGNIPIQCYNRVSGVLWTNDKFQVSTNKLTFLDLGVRLKEKSTYFERITSGQPQRSIHRKFSDWLRDCHERCDKQVLFQGFKECITRTDVAIKKHQYPWSVFESIVWEGKQFTAGQLVRTTRTNPIIYGTIKNFLLFGFHDGDVFATGGEMVLIQEPSMLYNELKTFPLSRLDRAAGDRAMKKGMDEEEGKLPHSLLVKWPDGNEVKPGSKVPAGSVIGDIQVQLVNKKGEEIVKLPNTNTAAKRFLMEQILIKHSSVGDSRIVYHISQHNKLWAHWFHRIEVVRDVGSYSLVLQAVLGESGATKFAGKTLPNVRIKFTVIEGPPAKFSIGLMEGPCRIGVPFSIPLQLRDIFNHLCKPDMSLIPEVKANGLDLRWQGVESKNKLLYIKNVTASGKVLSTQDFNLKVTIRSLQDATQKLRVRMLPGAVHSIKVTEFSRGTTTLENGEALSLEVELLDEAGNPTVERGAKVTCKFIGRPGLPVYKSACSQSGTTQLTGKPILLKNMSKTSVKITAKVELEGSSSRVSAVEQMVEIVPGTTPHFINVRYKDKTGKEITLVDGEVIECTVGEAVSNLVFAIWDEGRRQLPLTPSLVDKITVNWQSKQDEELIRQGRLPDVKAPTKVDESKYCKIDVTEGQGLSFSFSVKPLVGIPHHLKCVCKGSQSVKLNEFLDDIVEVHVTDSYGNSLKRLPQRALSKLKVTGRGLDEKALEIRNLPNIGFALNRLRFRGTDMSPKDVTVEYKEFRDIFRITVESGQPSQLQFVHYAPSDVIHLNQGNQLPKSLQLQICDSDGNPCKEPTAVFNLQIPSGLKLKNVSLSLKAQKYGRVDFGRPHVEGDWNRYEIGTSATIGRKKLNGPKLFVMIEADDTQPSKISVNYKKNWTYRVGEAMPDFEVRVESEAGTVLDNLPSQCICMRQWKPSSSQQVLPPSSAFSWVVDPHQTEDDPNCFYFRGRQAPEKAGFHHVIFEGNFKGSQIHSNVIVANVQPGAPESLAASTSPPTTLSVSNTPQPSSRCLISSMKLYLKDKYGNITGQNIYGQVKVTLYGKDSKEVPRLTQNQSSMIFPLKNGAVQLSNLYLQEGTPGQDGHEYVLKIALEDTTSKSGKTDVKPYLQPFMFYNDAKKQERMVTLNRERDDCRLILKKYDQIFSDSKEVHDTLKSEVKAVEQKESGLKNKLKRLGVPHTAILSLVSVNDTLRLCEDAKTNIEQAPRRSCKLQRFPSSDPDVLGKVAHLAEVEDDTIAWVLSWHLMSEMDCVITKTTAKAKEVHAACSGSQQVLPIDSIFSRNLPSWNSPLPHEKVSSLRQTMRPAGNPIHARHLLTFTKDEEDCRLLFRMILGDTIIFDTLDDATDYRKQVVQYTSCPTLLTREGNRMRSSGKFGGFQNRAPPLVKLRGILFGAPIPAKYGQTLEQIGVLRELKEVIEEREAAVTELQEHVNEMNSSKSQGRHREMEETRERLVQIEAKLKKAGKDQIVNNPLPMDTLDERQDTNRRSPRAAQLRDPRLQRDRTVATRRGAPSQPSDSPEPKRRR